MGEVTSVAPCSEARPGEERRVCHGELCVQMGWAEWVAGGGPGAVPTSLVTRRAERSGPCQGVGVKPQSGEKSGRVESQQSQSIRMPDW